MERKSSSIRLSDETIKVRKSCDVCGFHNHDCDFGWYCSGGGDPNTLIHLGKEWTEVVCDNFKVKE